MGKIASIAVRNEYAWANCFEQMFTIYEEIRNKTILPISKRKEFK
jgi:hypothetical protein